MKLDELPRSILFIGGGYIAFEFAHLAALAGSQVTVLHRGSRPLALFDPDLVDQLVERTRELGIDLRLATEATAIDKHSAELEVLASHSGETVSFQADMVVHAAGRVPEINDLNLDLAGIAWDKRGVRVNEFLQSVSNPSVYAAGDAAALRAATLGGAQALRAPDRGAMTRGRLADMVLWDADHEGSVRLGLQLETRPRLAGRSAWSQQLHVKGGSEMFFDITGGM